MSDVKRGVGLDPNAPVSRVPNQSYWADLARQELEEAASYHVADIHTVLCIDTSASVSQGSAWEQIQQFFHEFITGLEDARHESDMNIEHVALSVFGGEVKVAQRLTANYTLVKRAFSLLQPGGPSPLVGGLLMAIAGLSNTSAPSCNGIRIRPRIILITDGHPTNSLIVSGPDVRHSEPMDQVSVLLALSNIAPKSVRLYCIPVGDANVPFLEKISAQLHGKLFSYKDGRMLARRTICTFLAGHVISSWQKLKDVSKPFGIELSLEDAMKSNLQIASSSAEEQEQILEIARAALESALDNDDENELDKDHYECDDPDVTLPSLGTRVRRGPDCDKACPDDYGPGTIVGHHKNQKQVKVEWDTSRHSDFYRYGDLGKYDVLIDNEPRVLRSELIATGCLVRRGEHWRYDNQDGTPGAVGVVLKVQEDGIVVVRWPNKSKNYYRYGAQGCFDLEICHPEESPAGSQRGMVTQPEYALGPDLFISKEAQKQQHSIQKYHTESLKLPPLGTRVRRGIAWDKGQQDCDGPGTIVGHNESCSQVCVEWDWTGQRNFYYFNDTESSEVVVVDEPRVLQPYELIVTGCCVKRGKSWMYGNDNDTPDAIGVVLSVREDGMVLVRWPNKSKNYYRYGAEGYFDLEICSPHEDQTSIWASNQFTPKLGSAAAGFSLLGQSTSLESLKMSDPNAEVHLDWNESTSRVPSKSYWAKMAHAELEEGLKTPVTGVHTVLCVDISASIMQGSAWGQTQQFFTEFITELEKVRKELDVDTDNVALSVFGGEVKVVQRLTNNYTLIKQAFCALQPRGPSPLYAGLLMAAAGLQDTRTSSGITIRPQIILITDGHPTNSLISDGPDVRYSEAKEEDDVLPAVIAIASLNVELHCVPVGDANLPFLEKISAQSHGKLFSYQDGRILARRSLCNEDVLQISHETLEENHVKDDKTEFHLDHYEIDDPDVKLPCLGTRVRRGPEWNKGFQDNDGPGTIVSHHKNRKQVKVEWDKNGHTDFYRYGDLGKYDVLIDSEPRVLQSEPIATGCLVRRGEHWKYDNQDGTPGAVGVVLKVHADGTVVVRWPNKYIGHYRYRTDGYYDLSICNPNDIQVESHMPEFHAYNPSLDLSSTTEIADEDVQDKYTVLNKIEKLYVSSSSIHEQTERSIIQEKSGAHVEGVPVGFDRIKHIYYKKEDILGHGCNGTIVFRGKFDKRDVAVKRLLKEYFSLAEQEVKLLRESDQHPNVIRYFWMEEDIHFLFIALELCEGNLQDYVEDKLQNIINIEPIEVLHQALNGLAHLHSLGIVHRDIKPQNILISKPNAQGEVRAMISDFGFSKKLPPEKMAFSSRSNVLGTEGWISPEMLKSGHKRTTAVDIFSAGCMMHYVLTKGLHPFGNYASEIQCNIRQGKFNLGRLPMTSDGCIAKDIIEKMLSSEPQTRPTAKAVLNHLLFWKKTDKLQFIEAVSDWIVENMVHDLEQDETTIVNGDWTIHLSQELQNDIQKDLKEKEIQYSGSSVKDLLRVIRNKKLHYNKMPEDVRKSVGSLPDEYLDYFTSRFPLLMLHTYHGMECCAKEDTFKVYYKTE